jgi:PAS domain S-box-containing protein
MSVFPFLHLFDFIVYMYLAVYILIKNPKALLNRVCTAFLLCFAVWSFPAIFIHNPYVSKNTAALANNINALGWCSFSSFFLWFMLIFAGKKKILEKKWFYLLIFGIPLVFLYKQWTNLLLVDFSMEYFGWKVLWSRTIWVYLFYVYYISFMAVGIYLNLEVMKKAQNPILKKQAAIILITTALVLFLGTLTDVILPILKIHIIPNLANTIMLAWAFAVVYAIARYKFLTITPVTAADNIISTMYDCLILLNPGGEIITVNKAAADLLGYKAEELKGKPFGLLFKKKGLACDLMEKIFREGKLKNEDIVFKTRQGDGIPMLFSVSILRDGAGNAAGIVCVAKDISEREKLAEEIFKIKKLESIGILAGGVAHDFNNLFAIIIGNLTLARDEISPGQKSYKLLLKAEQTSLNAAELARKFLSFSPGRWLNKVRVPLSRILKNAREAEDLKSKIKIVYDIDLPDDLLPIYGDEAQLTQIMQNLFLNAAAAIEALPGGGRGKISLRAENTLVQEGKNGNNTRILLKKGKYVKMLIEDNGIGIPPNHIEKVFDPYFSTQDKTGQKGVGLGLTLCYSIIKKHDGHIDVESGLGKGTTFTLYLPAFIETDSRRP